CAARLRTQDRERTGEPPQDVGREAAVLHRESGGRGPQMTSACPSLARATSALGAQLAAARSSAATPPAGSRESLGAGTRKRWTGTQCRMASRMMSWTALTLRQRPWQYGQAMTGAPKR